MIEFKQEIFPAGQGHLLCMCYFVCVQGGAWQSEEHYQIYIDLVHPLAALFKWEIYTLSIEPTGIIAYMFGWVFGSFNIIS